jgi:hypothetical protein
MAEGKRKILVLVEGAKTDAALMGRLLSIYQIDAKYEIVSYRTNIYTLYQEMFEENDPSDMGKLYINYPMVDAQLDSIRSDRRVAVLSTCVFFVPEYYPNLLR